MAAKSFQSTGRRTDKVKKTFMLKGYVEALRETTRATYMHTCVYLYVRFYSGR